MLSSELGGNSAGSRRPWSPGRFLAARSPAGV